jgi:hypothetical protein
VLVVLAQDNLGFAFAVDPEDANAVSVGFAGESRKVFGGLQTKARDMSGKRSMVFRCHRSKALSKDLLRSNYGAFAAHLDVNMIGNSRVLSSEVLSEGDVLPRHDIATQQTFRVKDLYLVVLPFGCTSDNHSSDREVAFIGERLADDRSLDG